jgi:aspartyl-tRNA(Asn)/glutamyl-tRNA(Gln) amidotransferase subunit A
MDSLGSFTSSIADAAYVDAAVTGIMPEPVRRAESIVLALPGEHYFRNLDAQVQSCFDEALARIRAAGVHVLQIATPEAAEIDEVFSRLVPAEWLAFVGRERFLANEDRMDAVAAARARAGLDLRADEYVRLATRQRTLVRIMTERSRGIDAWITPTVPVTPMPCAQFRTVEDVGAWNRLNTQNTRPGNLFGQCGISLPIHHLGATLPVGLQLCGPPDSDARLLAVAAAIEAIVGRSSLPRLEAFVTA